MGRPYSVYVTPETPISVTYVKDAAWELLDLKNTPKERLTRRVHNLCAFSTIAAELVEVIQRATPDARLDFPSPIPK